MRRLVKQRDKGVCAICGTDTIKLRRWAMRWCRYGEVQKPSSYDEKFREGRHWNSPFLKEKFDRALAIFHKWERRAIQAAEKRRAKLAAAGWPLGRESFWDMDHIIPVIEGGGLCGLDNYRTLCVPCHKAETKKLAIKRAEERNQKRMIHCKNCWRIEPDCRCGEGKFRGVPPTRNYKWRLGKAERTPRGMSLDFKDIYGLPCSLQQSTLASEPALWLGVDDPEPKIMKSKALAHGLPLPVGEVSGWMPYPIPDDVLISSRMHLNVPQVKALIGHLQQWLKNEQF
jgi:hypothetical protein